MRLARFGGETSEPIAASPAKTEAAKLEERAKR